MPLSRDYFTGALDWLKRNKNRSAFATNHFGTTVKAIEFVERLYAAGAEDVVMGNVYDEPERIKQEGGPYGDTLIVLMPDDPSKRAAIFEIYSTECTFQPEFDKGQDSLMFWWD
jgi:hypothetical protein